MAQYGIGRKVIMTILDVVDIAGNVHNPRTCLDTGAGNGAVEAVRPIEIRSSAMSAKIVGKMAQGID